MVRDSKDELVVDLQSNLKQNTLQNQLNNSGLDKSYFNHFENMNSI